MNIISSNQVRFIGIRRVNEAGCAECAYDCTILDCIVCSVVFASTYAVYATADNFDYTNNREIIKQCTENKIVVIKDNVIQCKVLDKNALSGSE